MDQEKSGEARIYGLCDPVTGELRYVGMSMNPDARYLSHIRERRRRTPLYSWIASLRAKGAKPEMFVIESVPASKWKEAEQFWIAYFRFVGADLTNLARGGDMPAPTREQRQRAARAAVVARKSKPDAKAWKAKHRLCLAMNRAMRSGDFYLSYKVRFLLALCAATVPRLFPEWNRV